MLSYKFWVVIFTETWVAGLVAIVVMRRPFAVAVTIRRVLSALALGVMSSADTPPKLPRSLAILESRRFSSFSSPERTSYESPRGMPKLADSFGRTLAHCVPMRELMLDRVLLV